MPGDERVVRADAFAFLLQFRPDFGCFERRGMIEGKQSERRQRIVEESPVLRRIGAFFHTDAQLVKRDRGDTQRLRGAGAGFAGHGGIAA